ncbi:MAG: DUF4169 family protein [Hyphomonadaceae bacterium]|nr:DUF4169 family protein [Hyphomonadaceae bacterium]
MVEPPKPPAAVLNLRRARKARDRDAQRADADARRLQHGRAKEEKSLTKARNEKALRDLDASRRDNQDGNPSES